MTVWTTHNDHNRNYCSLPCGTEGCIIPKNSNHCTRCLEPAFVTSQAKTVRRQAAHTFKKKFAPRQSLPVGTSQEKNNHFQEPICHLKPNPPAEGLATHPSHRSIHALLDPAYTPQATKAHYANIMDPPTYVDFTQYMKGQKGNSAPGPSKFRYSMLQKSPPAVHRILHHLVCICLLLRGIPKQLKNANLYPIPKSNGILLLDKMRPITLLEIGYKLTTGWLAHKIRQLAASAPHPLWAKTQYGGTGDAHDALLRFSAALEDANDHP